MQQLVLEVESEQGKDLAGLLLPPHRLEEAWEGSGGRHHTKVEGER